MKPSRRPKKKDSAISQSVHVNLAQEQILGLESDNKETAAGKPFVECISILQYKQAWLYFCVKLRRQGQVVPFFRSLTCLLLDTVNLYITCFPVCCSSSSISGHGGTKSWGTGLWHAECDRKISPYHTDRVRLATGHLYSIKYANMI